MVINYTLMLILQFRQMKIEFHIIKPKDIKKLAILNEPTIQEFKATLSKMGGINVILFAIF